MTDYAVPVARGCGSRVEGGVYLTVGLGPGGAPIEDFLIDPPTPALSAWNLAPIGVQVLPRRNRDGTTTYHVFDWVGSSHYPNVADFVEEARRFGVSRRISAATDFSKLGPDSMLILLHSRAYIENAAEYLNRPGWEGCPKCLVEHEPAGLLQAGLCCAGLWWDDVTGGVPSTRPPITGDVTRKMPSFAYTARSAPPGVTPAYSEQPAMFARFPITAIEVVQGEGAPAPGPQAARAFARASKSGIPTRLTDC